MSKQQKENYHRLLDHRSSIAVVATPTQMIPASICRRCRKIAERERITWLVAACRPHIVSRPSGQRSLIPADRLSSVGLFLCWCRFSSAIFSTPLRLR